jgi:putative methyltransferase (TIGR04325 family)
MSESTPIRRLGKLVLPPIVVSLLKRIVRGPLAGSNSPPEWEYVPAGWRSGEPVKGWNDESVLRTQFAKWPDFLRLVRGTGPLGIYHEAATLSDRNPVGHNTLMTYGYVLARAARKKDRISLLDWGGGVGHYGVISRALLPDVEIDYHCRDVPILCQGGRELLPDALFYEDDQECLARTYDLVLASSSLQYWEDWQAVTRRLAAVSRPYLFITRLPIVHQVDSFVVVQRPHMHGYTTEYLGWVLNRQALLDHLTDVGMTLVREVLIDERPSVHGAPEQCEMRGFLFTRGKQPIT